MSIPVYTINTLEYMCACVLIPHTLTRICFISSSIFHFCYTQLCPIVCVYTHSTTSLLGSALISRLKLAHYTKVCVWERERVDAFVCYNPKIAAYSIERMPTSAVDMRMCNFFRRYSRLHSKSFNLNAHVNKTSAFIFDIFGSQHDKRACVCCVVCHCYSNNTHQS